jgi:hypothetical protein
VPLVLLIDEADLISGPAMVSFLRQLRDGFTTRGVGRFPTSVALIGVRALRDYPVQRKDGPVMTRARCSTSRRPRSPCAIILRAEVAGLLGQHTEETGQAFTGEAVAELARITDGQPFLVNALADLCVTALVPDRAAPVTAAHVDQAREPCSPRRAPPTSTASAPPARARRGAGHPSDHLGRRAAGARGAYRRGGFQLIDRGLLRRGPGWGRARQPHLCRAHRPHPRAERPGEPRAPVVALGHGPAVASTCRPCSRPFASGGARTPTSLGRCIPEYPEAVPHLALCGFLQRVVNGGGRVHREFAAGRGAMDLLISYGPDRFAIELKRVRSRDRLETVVERGAAQLGRYLDTVGLDMGWLVVFDVRPDRSWEERLWSRELEVGGKKVVVLGA